MSNTPVVSLVENLAAISPPTADGVPFTQGVKPFEQAERDNVLQALKISNYRIRGKGGAAELLNVKPTTLEAKMARLGIQRNR
jgi:transcriptional regulator with GAF, ATPase, and Fis domain